MRAPDSLFCSECKNLGFNTPDGQFRCFAGHGQTEEDEVGKDIRFQCPVCRARISWKFLAIEPDRILFHHGCERWPQRLDNPQEPPLGLQRTPWHTERIETFSAKPRSGSMHDRDAICIVGDNTVYMYIELDECGLQTTSSTPPTDLSHLLTSYAPGTIGPELTGVRGPACSKCSSKETTVKSISIFSAGRSDTHLYLCNSCGDRWNDRG